METLNRNHISYQEMDGLIELAEKVSVNIEDIKHKIKIQYAYIVLYFALSLLIVLLIISGMFGQFLNTISISAIPELVLRIVGGITVGGFCGQSLLKLQELLKMKSTINREQIVIQKLLNMIEGYKDLYIENEYDNESSVLSKALFEMRLSRINFGVK
jgi:hypothetical protein